MSLDELKKEFMQIAIRYDSKRYLSATYRNYLFDGIGFINNTINEPERVDSHFSNHVQKIIAKDLEIKTFLIELKNYARENDLSKLYLTIIKGEVLIQAYKEVQVELEDKMPFGEVMMN